MTLRFGTAAALVALAACSAPSAQQALSASEAGSNVQAVVPAGADAQTRKVVAAANAFLATLTLEQKAAVMFEYADAAQRVRWSNLPEGIVSRKGLARRDMSAPQKAALETLLASVLSAKGMQMVHEQMDADDELLKEGSGQGGPGGGGPGGGAPRGPPPGGAGGPAAGPRPGGGGGGGGGGGQGGAMRGPGGLNFGSHLYFVSFLGAPSTTAPWTLQYGGHHLAINASIVGPNISLSPSLTGGQPLKYVKDGKTVWIVENEVTQSRAMLNVLNPAQRAKAALSTQRIDLVTGPGHDGQVLQPEGLPAGEMTGAQKAQFLKLIEARLDIVNDDDLAALMAIVRRNLNQTYFAWWGPTDPVGAAYFRVTGPDLLIEFSPQGMGGDYTQHAHNMYRDGHNEYGAGWARAR